MEDVATEGHAPFTPAWRAATIYAGGEKVSYQGHIYQAQWYSAGVAHTAAPCGPWTLLS